MKNANDIKGYYSIDDQFVEELYLLQVELLKLQKFIQESSARLLIIFEGRDTAGKGRAIFRFTQFMNPQHFRTVALGKPTELEKGQWYFQRYINKLPNPVKLSFLTEVGTTDPSLNLLWDFAPKVNMNFSCSKWVKLRGCSSTTVFKS